MPDRNIAGSCHCGAVTFTANPGDRFLVSCNCSICRRLNTKWLHCPPATSANMTKGLENTVAYSWGDKDLNFHSCKTCGCTTHWSSNISDRIAVNMTLADDPRDIADIPLRHFDGADSWEFLD